MWPFDSSLTSGRSNDSPPPLVEGGWGEGAVAPKPSRSPLPPAPPQGEGRSLVNPLSWREHRHFVGQRPHLDRTVIEPHVAPLVTPGERVLHPMLVVAFRILVMGVRATAFGTRIGADHGGHGVAHQVLQLQRLH